MHTSKHSIQQHYRNDLIDEINSLAIQEDNYKYRMYKTFNPDLKPVDLCNTPIKFIRLRLGSHHMPIETGRWRRIPRIQRLCQTCGIVGDEVHYIYDCPDIDRYETPDIPNLHELDKYSKLDILIRNLDFYL